MLQEKKHTFDSVSAEECSALTARSSFPNGFIIVWKILINNVLVFK